MMFSIYSHLIGESISVVKTANKALNTENGLNLENILNIFKISARKLKYTFVFSSSIVGLNAKSVDELQIFFKYVAASS